MDPLTAVLIDKVLLPVAIDLVKQRLKDFAESVQIGEASPQPQTPDFPSAALVGLGQCGTNICLNVAKLLSAVDEEPGKATETTWSRALGESFQTFFGATPERHLFAPVILLADLNVDTRDTLLRKHGDTAPIAGYRRCHFIDLAWLGSGGSGNVPHQGQFLGRLALASGIDDVPAGAQDRSDWLRSRAYFIDSLGLRENSSRLLFCTFSTGGGTGSGLSLEIGSAQQLIHEQRKQRSHARAEDKSTAQEMIEPVCALGIGIMPRTTDDSIAQSINTGRCVCAYLSREQAFDKQGRPRIFNGLALVSNDLMTWADEAGDHVQNKEVFERANEYVAQNMFHLLASQALSKDYVSRLEELKNLGIDVGETIRLDASDLANSLRGLTFVSYAESVPGKLDMLDLLRRAVSIPRFNAETQCLEGVSLAPLPKADYAAVVGAADGELARHLGQKVAVFSQTSTAVVILSVPSNYAIKEKDLKALRQQTELLVPRANIRRYALVRGASRNIGLCIVFGEGACLSPEVLGHLFGYLSACFRQKDVDQETFVGLLSAVVGSRSKDDLDGSIAKLMPMMNEREDPGAILAGVESTGMLAELKGQLSARAAEIGLTGVGMDDVLLTRDEALATLTYLNKVYRYQGLRRVQVQALSTDAA